MKPMKFFSYTNNNCNYTKACSLANVRSVHLITGDGKSAIRYSVRINYTDDSHETLAYLESGEAKSVFEKIINLLNK